MAHLSKKRKERIAKEKLCSRESTPSSAENPHRCQALAASDWPDAMTCVPIGYLKMGCRCGPPFFLADCPHSEALCVGKAPVNPLHLRLLRPMEPMEPSVQAVRWPKSAPCGPCSVCPPRPQGRRTRGPWLLTFVNGGSRNHLSGYLMSGRKYLSAIGSIAHRLKYSPFLSDGLDFCSLSTQPQAQLFCRWAFFSLQWPRPTHTLQR